MSNPAQGRCGWERADLRLIAAHLGATTGTHTRRYTTQSAFVRFVVETGKMDVDGGEAETYQADARARAGFRRCAVVERVRHAYELYQPWIGT